MATVLRNPAGARADALVERVADAPVLPLGTGNESGLAQSAAPQEPKPVEPSRALALSDVIAAPAGPGESRNRGTRRAALPFLTGSRSQDGAIQCR